MRRSLATLALALILVPVGAVLPGGPAVQAAPPELRAETVSGAVSTTRVFEVPAAGHVALYWPGRPGANVTVAFGDGETFGPATDAGRDEVGEHRGDGITYGAVLAAGGATAVRVTTDVPLPRLDVLAMSETRGTTPPAETADAASSTVGATSSVADPGGLGIVPRAGWGADENYRTWEPEFYATQKLVVHHTATSNDYDGDGDPTNDDVEDAKAQVRAIYYYHAITQKWGDIGYNVLIDKFGTIYEGRYSGTGVAGDDNELSEFGENAEGLGVTAAHTAGWNSGSVGIALLGTHTDDELTPAARESLERVLAREAGDHTIDPEGSSEFVNPVSGSTTTTENIAGHRDYAATECPGEALYARLPAVRTGVATRLAGGTSDIYPPSAPGDLAIAAAGSAAVLTWTAATDGPDDGTATGVDGYVVWRSRQSGTGYEPVGNTDASTLTFTDPGTAGGRPTYYRVQAVDGAGNVGPFAGPVSTKDATDTDDGGGKPGKGARPS